MNYTVTSWFGWARIVYHECDGVFLEASPILAVITLTRELLRCSVIYRKRFRKVEYFVNRYAVHIQDVSNCVEISISGCICMK